MASVLRIADKDILHCIDGIASVVDPQKGRILFATKHFPKDSVIAQLRMSDIKSRIVSDIECFKQYLKATFDTREGVRECIQHSVPTGNGKILIPNTWHWNNYFNHSTDANVFTECAFYTKERWNLIAIKDIQIGDELVQNYNQSVGYELRDWGKGK